MIPAAMKSNPHATTLPSGNQPGRSLWKNASSGANTEIRIPMSRIVSPNNWRALCPFVRLHAARPRDGVTRVTLLPDYLVESFDHLRGLLGRNAGDAPAQPLDRKSADLADFHPGALGQAGGPYLEGEWEPGALRLAGDGGGDDCAGPRVENVVAQDQPGTPACLLGTARRAQVSPPHLSSQYGGHAPRSAESSSSARAFSNAVSRLAHSRARRPRSRRASFSATACSTARPAFGTPPRATRRSSRASLAPSSETAILGRSTAFQSVIPNSGRKRRRHHNPRGAGCCHRSVARWSGK